MNKAALKTFATWARRQLIDQVSIEAARLGLTASQPIAYTVQGDYLTIGTTQYPLAWREAVDSLNQAWHHHGFAQLVEEVAYTWFNRFIAIRYMEVHDYLPSHVRVLSSLTPGQVDPDILLHYRDLQWPLDVVALDQAMSAGNREAVFRQLLIEQCNQLHVAMPFLFEKLKDYTELLLPAHLLHTDSVLRHLVAGVPEEDFQEVEVIGWLYQYYIADQKDAVFKDLKAGKKIGPENIPAATQLFTPEWIVRYMVENSAGRLWKESHPDYQPATPWRYFIDDAEQPNAVKAQLSALARTGLQSEDVTIMDPACGSGHILVYAFDLLYEIYEDAGYPSREIPRRILENNLYGLEIDNRAAQLASFALLMKARAYSARILTNPPVPHVVAIKDTRTLDRAALAEVLANHLNIYPRQVKAWLDSFVEAENLGSLIQPPTVDTRALTEAMGQIESQGLRSLFDHGRVDELALVKQVIQQTNLLTRQYDVVVTNPPYMGARGMNAVLATYLKKNYPLGKADLFAAFLLRCFEMTKPGSFTATINQQSWMFLSTYEALRKRILESYTILSMIHLGPRAFDELQGWVVQSTSFVGRAVHITDYITTYVRLTEYLSSGEKEKQFIQGTDRFYLRQEEFFAIPGSPIAYWASETVRTIFRQAESLDKLARPRLGMTTGDNETFVRHWYEVNQGNIDLNTMRGLLKWVPYNKGGEFRKWYGNQEYVINWDQSGREIKSSGSAFVRNESFYYCSGITWSFVSSSKLGVRYSPPGFIFDVAGSSLFPEEEYIPYITAFLCSSLAYRFMQYLNPTLNFQVGNIACLPLIVEERIRPQVDQLAQENIQIAQEDWDDFETSWNFVQHPFLKHRSSARTIVGAFAAWHAHADQRFRKMQQNEEQLNHLFINLYGLQEELTPEVPDDEITLRRADEVRDAKSFLSYFIGCLMGRYSLDVPGLTYAGGNWGAQSYQTFQPVADGIVVLTDDRYFDQDIMGRLEEFLVAVYGRESLDENLRWLADRVDRRAEDDAATRLRRYFLQEFFKDHCKVYSKRPIYWLFDSGPDKGFRALVYLHRYTPDTVARVRLEYLQPLQVRVAEELRQWEARLAAGTLSRAERRGVESRIDVLLARQAECVRYDQVLADLANQRIALDLDDGVKVNYAKLQSALAVVK